MGHRKKRRVLDAQRSSARPKGSAGKTSGEATTSLKALLSDVRFDERPKPSPEPSQPSSSGPSSSGPSSMPSVAVPSATPMASARDVRPSETLRGDDRIAYYDAYAGVRPLGKTRRKHRRRPDVSAPPVLEPSRSRADEEARARLAALVAGGVRFEIERVDERVRGRRAGLAPRVAEVLERQGVVPEATLDLHGMRADEAEREVVRFVRRQHGGGARRVAIVHGKGLHSEGGLGVLRDRVLHALTEGGAAPVVKAFATASPSFGGSGALMVELTDP